jgi:hypothetical protein
MTWGPHTGIGIERVAEKVMRRVGDIDVLSLNGAVQRAEGSITFKAIGRDGAEFEVSVKQTKEPLVTRAIKSPRKADAEMVAEKRQERYFEAMERRRKRFLCEI